MSNCYVNVKGGIGNQLFQISAGYAYAKKYDKKLIINPSRWNAGQGNHVLSYKDTIFKNFEYETYHTRDVIEYHEKKFNWDEIPYYPGNIALNGYFQSLKYFEEVKDEFISQLNLPNFVIQKFIGDVDVAFHIRRGDYLKSSNIHYICKTEYFDYFFDIFGPSDLKKTRILVFTDSSDHVLEEFKDKKFHIIRSESDVKELAYMSQCDTIVGSNSTFSWWASLIGGKKCYFPSKWFADGRPHEDIFRKDMILHDV